MRKLWSLCALVLVAFAVVGCGDKAAAAFAKGEALEKDADFEGALAAYEEAVKANPESEFAKKAQANSAIVKMTLDRIKGAKDTVGSITKSMMNAYDREPASDTLTLGATPGHKLCPATTQPVPANPNAFSGGIGPLTAYDPQPTDWSGPSWTCLKFSLRDKMYFQYEVKVDGEKAFTVVARRAVGTKTIEVSQTGTVDGGRVKIGQVEVTRK